MRSVASSAGGLTWSSCSACCNNQIRVVAPLPALHPPVKTGYELTGRSMLSFPGSALSSVDVAIADVTVGAGMNKEYGFADTPTSSLTSPPRTPSSLPWTPSATLCRWRRHPVSGQRFSSVVARPAAEEHTAVHGATPDECKAMFQDVVGKGHRLTCLHAYGSGSIRMAAPFRKAGGPDWFASRAAQRRAAQTVHPWPGSARSD